MIFNSIDFVVFFLVVYGLYLVLPHRGQNVLLLVASYYFYGSWDWRFLSLLLISTVTDYVMALLIDRSELPARRKLYVVISMCISIGMLGFFKYFNFFVDSLVDMLGGLGFDAGNWQLHIILPIGISFYTFQTINYTIDVYRRHMKPTRNLLDFAVFVGFFPHLVAGPIMRASNLLPQVMQPRTITRTQVEEGAWLILWGLFKKAVIADNLALIVNQVFGGEVQLTLGSVLLGVYAFAFQIYGDFSGYTDIARGISKLMGFELVVNFNNPYFAINPSDFWRRWHISLSTWLRDYLYIPLGGNRKGVGRTYWNLSLTMILGGLWHGAAWTFVIWGAYHGCLLMFHRLISGEGRKNRPQSFFSNAWRMVLMFHAVCLSWLLFRATSMDQVYQMLGAAIANPVLGPDAGGWIFQLVLLCLPLWLVQILQERRGTLDAPLRLSLVPRTALCFVVLLMLVCLGSTGGQAFIYFQF